MVGRDHDHTIFFYRLLCLDLLHDTFFLITLVLREHGLGFCFSFGGGGISHDLNITDTFIGLDLWYGSEGVCISHELIITDVFIGLWGALCSVSLVS